MVVVVLTSGQEIDELVEEFEPEPLLAPSKKIRENDLDAHIPIVTRFCAACGCGGGVRADGRSAVCRRQRLS
jgi:hypothetical protein